MAASARRDAQALDIRPLHWARNCPGDLDRVSYSRVALGTHQPWEFSSVQAVLITVATRTTQVKRQRVE